MNTHTSSFFRSLCAVLCLSLLLAACGETDGNTREKGAHPANHLLSLTLSSSSRSQRFMGVQTGDLTSFSWEPGDTLHLACVQNNQTYYLQPQTIDGFTGNKAFASIVLPMAVDTRKPYDLYGYVGKAAWDKTGGAPQLKVPASGTVVQADGIKDVPLYFLVKGQTGNAVQTVLKHLGFIYVFKLFNYKNSPLQLKQIRLNFSKPVTFPKAMDRGCVVRLGDEPVLRDGTMTVSGKTFVFDAELGAKSNRDFYLWQCCASECSTTDFDVTAAASQQGGKDISLEGTQNILVQQGNKNYVYALGFADTGASLLSAWRARPQTGFNFDRWMGSIPDNTPFIRLFIPGTHDACTYSFGTGGLDLSYKCQSEDIARQLNDGVRALDLRPLQETNGGKDVVIYHGKGLFGRSTNVTLSQVYETTIDFLAKHPSEVVVFLIKDENANGGRGIKGSIQYLSEKYKEHIFFGMLNKHTTLKELRGRIVPLYRDELLAGVTHTCYVGSWPESYSIFASQLWRCSESGQRLAGSISLDLLSQDNYKAPSKEIKQKNAEDLMEASPGNYVNGTWGINYLSASDVPVGWKPFQYAEYLNDKFSRLLQNPTQRYCQMLFIDYAGYNFGRGNLGVNLLQSIVLNNFRIY